MSTVTIKDVPNDLYKRYLKVLKDKNKNRMGTNREIFIRALEREIEQHNNSKQDS